MKYFIIAGEASGDLHAARLMKALLAADPDAHFRYQGGDLMAEVSGDRIRHFSEGSFMLLEVVLHLRSVLRGMSLMRREMSAFSPDVVVLVDYPGFNLRMASFARKQGWKVFYYISPKIWAWKKGRIRKIKRFVDRMFVIFPFEVDYYSKRGIEVEYSGNPLVDAVQEFTDREKTPAPNDTERPVIALLAGSRKQEIRRILPVMVNVAARFPEYRFIVTGAPAIEEEFYTPFLKDSALSLVMNRTYQVLLKARTAIVTSGTATLETALFGVPQVVVYRMGRLTYQLGRVLLKIPFISLVNIILERALVKELIQVDLEERISRELQHLTEDEEYRTAMKEGYDIIKRMLGEPGAADRAGRRMVELLKTADR